MQIIQLNFTITKWCKGQDLLERALESDHSDLFVSPTRRTDFAQTCHLFFPKKKSFHYETFWQLVMKLCSII